MFLKKFLEELNNHLGCAEICFQGGQNGGCGEPETDVFTDHLRQLNFSFYPIFTTFSFYEKKTLGAPVFPPPSRL